MNQNGIFHTSFQRPRIARRWLNIKFSSVIHVIGDEKPIYDAKWNSCNVYLQIIQAANKPIRRQIIRYDLSSDNFPINSALQPQNKPETDIEY